MPPAFHFLRPEWLLALLPAALLALVVWRRLGAGNRAWEKLVDAHLLRHLAQSEARGARKWPALALLAGWTLAAIAMAGPTWRKLPSPTLDRREATVVALSLAQSMNALDESPSRLGAARHKLEDILRRERGGQIGLVLFADRPFVASPLTEDGRVLAQMLPELGTDLMPVLANRPDLAIAKAAELLAGAGAPSGRIVLLTDGAGDAPELTDAAAAAAARAGYEVSVIGLGSPEGSDLIAFDGRTLRASDGSPAITRLDAKGLAQVAAAGGGAFTTATAGSADLDRVFASTLAGGDLLQKSGLSADQWADMGPYLLLVLLLIAPLAFRRGWIAILVLAALPVLSAPDAAQAQEAGASASRSVWQNLWQTPDQKGASAFTQGDYETAAKNFEDPAWRASALYKAGDYEGAAEAFGKLPKADYNRGNALAKAGQLEDARKAYDAALAADPNNREAAENRAEVDRLIAKKKQEEEDKKKKDEEKKKQDKDQKDKDSLNLGQNDSDPKDKGPPDPFSKNQRDKNQGDKNQRDKPGQDKPGQDKAEGGPPNEPKPAGAKPDGPKPPEGKPPQDKPSEDKPSEAKAPDAKPPSDPPPQAKSDPQAPKPGPQPRPQPSPPPQTDGAQPAAPVAQPPAQPAGPPPDQKQAPVAPVVSAQQAQAEADQTKEQMLRMVPDDPGRLMRARIRSYYYRVTPPGFGAP